MSTEWFYRIDQLERGPVESKTLKLLAEVGQITPNTLVRKATSKSWTEAHHVKQLFDAHDPSRQTINAPPIIEQSSDSEHEKAVPVKPPQVRAVAEPPPIIPTAKLAPPESDAFTTQINIVTTPNLNGSSHPTNADDNENINNNDSGKRPLTLVLTLVGLIILTIPTAWYLYNEPTTPLVPHPPAPNADLSVAANSPAPANSPPSHATLINNVFTKQSRWIDPTNDQFQLTRDAGLSITHVWIDTQQTEHPVLNIVIKIENRNKSNELSLQRRFANQNAASQPDEMNPYVPLIRFATGDGHTLDSETELVNCTIPTVSAISETYRISLTAKQITELDLIRVAVPKAWFNKSGYWGFKIPEVMITATNPAQIPVQIASDPNAPSGNLVNPQPSNVVDEESATTKPPATGEGVLPPAAFGNNATPTKPKNGDQPTTITELQSQIEQEKNNDPEPSGDEPPQ
mgnify:CR=1 FL=1